MRYFQNTLSDAASGGDPVDIDASSIKQNTVEVISTCLKYMKASTSNFDGGIYVGYPGLAYALVHIAENPVFLDEKKRLLDMANKLMQDAVQHISRSNHRKDSSFILGDSGVLVTAALLENAMGNKSQALEYANKFASLASHPEAYTYDELFVGRTGFLCGLIKLRKTFQEDIVNETIVFAMCDAVIDSGKNYSRQIRSKCPLMYQYYNTRYLGAAHGLCSILLMLMQFPIYLNARPQSAALIRESVNFMIAVTPKSTNNLPPDMEELYDPHSHRGTADELVHWCHGAPGVIYTYARAYLIWNDKRYLEECERCADAIWKRGLLKKGPGICHGIAGNAYAFLLLYRLTKSDVYLKRAVQFYNFLQTEQFRTQARVPDSPYSLYEGWAGTCCFMADLLSPQSAQFPFFDVFDN